MTPCPKCGHPHYSSIDYTLICAICNTVVHIVGVARENEPSASGVITGEYQDPHQKIEQLKQQGRECWVALHTMESPTIEKVQSWISTVPAINCGCRQFARDYVQENPPPCDDLQNFRRWTYEFHCQVDAKTRDPIMAWEDACKHWGW